MRALLVMALCFAMGGAELAAAAPLPPDQVDQVRQIVRDYIKEHPEIITDTLNAAAEKAKAEADARAKVEIGTRHKELFADAASPVGGNPNGDVTIVEFFDYRCPYCKQVQPALAALLKEDPKLRIVYKEFPILGPTSVYAARAALAARKQGKYEAFHNAVMEAKGQLTEAVVMRIAASVGLDTGRLTADMRAASIDESFQRNQELAAALNIQGTPGFVVGDSIVPGAADIAQLRAMVGEVRQRAAHSEVIPNGAAAARQE